MFRGNGFFFERWTIFWNENVLPSYQILTKNQFRTCFWNEDANIVNRQKYPRKLPVKHGVGLNKSLSSDAKLKTITLRNDFLHKNTVRRGFWPYNMKSEFVKVFHNFYWRYTRRLTLYVNK